MSKINNLETIEIRRHNGQNDYGEWETYDQKWHPYQLGEELAEVSGENGVVQVGGQKWAWRRTGASA